MKIIGDPEILALMFLWRYWMGTDAIPVWYIKYLGSLPEVQAAVRKDGSR